jgi:5-methylcytosine-specific restriction endonuclease McrBC GTP-binding regulatory subunit McrB
MSNNDELLKELENSIDSKSLILKGEWGKSIAKTDKGRVAFLPVRPDWNEPRKMSGYYNPLTGLFYPTDALKVLLNAFRDYAIFGNEEKKYFIILDEMNLARVEYYMSDLLSLMENMWKRNDDNLIQGETTQIHPYINACVLSNPKGKKNEETGAYECSYKGKEECKKCLYYPLLKQELNDWKPDKDFRLDGDPIPPRIGYPANLTIIGTVNVDETTFSFSPKVLDRAFVVEFNDVDIIEYCEEYNIDNEDFKGFVIALHDILKPVNLHFGYRVISEMWNYLKEAGEHEEPSAQSLDFLLKSKVLPKIHGTEEQIGKVLEDLFKFCRSGDIPNGSNKADEGGINKNEEKWWDNNIVGFKYPDSAKKIQDMYKRMKAVGYASFF